MQKLSPDELAAVIREMVAYSGLRPEEVNDGNCENFACELVHRLGYGTDRWYGEDATGEEKARLWGVHCFVEIDGRYYDSETPEGVDDWRTLPCFCRYEEYRRKRDAEFAARDAEIASARAARRKVDG